MQNNFSEAMQQRFLQDLQQMNLDPDDSDLDSQQSQDYYQYERKRMQTALSLLKTQKQNTILNELKKNTLNEDEYLDQFQDEVSDLHNITRNNDGNVLGQSVIQEIKEKVFNQSRMNVLQLADHELDKKSKQIQKNRMEEIVKNGFKKSEKNENAEIQIQNVLDKRMEQARIQRQVLQMGRQDQLSMKYEQQLLSQFFSVRFIVPKFVLPPTKKNNVIIQNFTPKPTFTHLRPLPNTQNNVLPKNAPQLALRRLERSKRIIFKSTSVTAMKIKMTKINPQQIQTSNKSCQKTNIPTDIDLCLQEYLKYLQPILPSVTAASKAYKPKFINCFPTQNQQNFNIDTSSQANQKSIADCFQCSISNPQNLTNLKLTYQNIYSLNGIEAYPNIQHTSLQSNNLMDITAIKGCTKLIQINISHNKIKEINGLKQMKWLKILNAQHNIIEAIQLNGGALQVLNVAHNRIQNIVNLSKNIYMKRLIINNNNLHELEGLTNLHFLEELTANNNYIKSVQGLQSCILLHNLNLSNNRLQTLHKNFTYMFLQSLSLSSNQLTLLPNMFLPALQQLILTNNRIQIQKNFIYLPNLKSLDLNKNGIEGFCVVWGFVRYCRGLMKIFYEENDCFRDARQKVRQVYEHIIYKNMNKLQIINHNVYDIGIKKYYQGVYSNYLSSNQLFKPQSQLLSHISKKINLVIQQNEFMSGLEDKKSMFAETQVFIYHKSIMKVNDLIQIVGFLNQQNQNKNNFDILNANRSIFYQHDLFQYGLRKNLHKIKGLIIAKQYRMGRKKKYFEERKEQISILLSKISEFVRRQRKLLAVSSFNKPIKYLRQQKASIIIQKNWRCYRQRKNYLKYLQKMKATRDEFELQEFDLDDYNFDKIETPQLDMPIHVKQDYHVKPQALDLLNKKQSKRQKILEDISKAEEIEEAKLLAQIQKNQFQAQQAERKKKMQESSSSFSSSYSIVRPPPQQPRQNIIKRGYEDEIERLMSHWGVSRAGAQTMYANNKRKQAQKLKMQEKNMSAAQRYERLRLNNR